MTAQEQQMIQSLADRINNTPLNEKDPDAEQLLQQALGRNPDALYILAQTTLVQQYALEQAQKQLAEARAQAEQQRQQSKHATSFLGSLLGHNDEPTPPPPPPPYTPVPSYSQQGYGSQGRAYPVGGSSFSGPGAGPAYGPGYGGVYAPPPPPPGYGQPQYGQPPISQPQSGGFLRSAMQTATGVAAGALAFEGIESLMHGFGGNSFGGGMGSGMGGRPEEIINNNYYGDSAPGEHHGMSSDIEDRRHEAGSFGDAVNRDDHNFGKDDLLDGSGSDTGDTGGTDDSTFYDNSSDASSFDDGGGSDDSSGSDDGS